MLEKLKKNLDKGIMTVGLQSSTYLEVNKRKNKMDSIHVNIQQMTFALGEAVFSQWKDTGIDMGQVENMCKSILEQEQEFKKCQAEIEHLEAEKDRLLSEKNAPDVGMIVCACGYQNSNDAKFCAGCGSLIPHSEEVKSLSCADCGSQLEDGARFCSNCGAEQGKSEL